MENAFSPFYQPLVELNFEWVIEEPGFLLQKNGDGFLSSDLFAKANNKIRWRLAIFINGEKDENQDYFCLYLHRVLAEEKDPAPVVVKLKLCSISKNSKQIQLPVDREKQQEMGKPSKNHPTCGWFNMVKKELIQRDDQHTGIDELKICLQLIYTI